MVWQDYGNKTRIQNLRRERDHLKEAQEGGG
jgi:hypothetical protein